MAVFKRNSNEAAFAGGEKHFVDVIKNRSDNDTLIFKNPEEDFNNGTTLVVGPGEKAIFVYQGTIEQIFDPGSYTLTSANYPFISRLRNSLSGGVSSFHSLVYFVRTATSREIKWGTQTPIKVYDKALGDQFQGIGVETEVRARGAYRIKVDDCGIFLTQLIGNNYDLTDQESITDYFRNQFLGHIVSILTTELTKWEGPLISVPANAVTYAKTIEDEIVPIAAEYGMKVLNFSISAIDIVDNEARQEAQELVSKNREQFYGRMAQGQGEAAYAQGQQSAYETYGTNYQQAQVLNAMNGAASNPGSDGGALLGAGMGLTMGAGMGQVIPNMVNQTMGQAQAAPQPASVDPVERLSRLKEMLSKELISQEEYEAKKADILKEM
ncbi:SPFH domain-containing protein [Bifidobacterium sp. A11]|uniref:SPFH domain-containing protein n=1 Tax=Bifidobacterium sp. A11 TaxID=1394176 RepID=UPI0004178DB8|nr:SPFH domain-containing protein [Bifidobacterium sp. A11]